MINHVLSPSVLWTTVQGLQGTDSLLTLNSKEGRSPSSPSSCEEQMNSEIWKMCMLHTIVGVEIGYLTFLNGLHTNYLLFYVQFFLLLQVFFHFILSNWLFHPSSSLSFSPFFMAPQKIIHDFFTNLYQIAQECHDGLVNIIFSIFL